MLISDGSTTSGDHTELLCLPLSHQNDGEAAYLTQAAAALTAAMQKETDGEISGAIRGYKTAVDILITGVQGETVRNKNILVYHVLPVPA